MGLQLRLFRRFCWLLRGLFMGLGLFRVVKVRMCWLFAATVGGVADVR